MIQLKIFYSSGTDSALENVINEWLKNNDDKISIVNITSTQSSTSGGTRLVTVIVHYKPLPKDEQ